MVKEIVGFVTATKDIKKFEVIGELVVMDGHWPPTIQFDNSEVELTYVKKEE
jgi:hypothetical protein